MFYANAASGWYSIHDSTCRHAIAPRSSWWHGPFNTYMEACIPAVKARTTPHPCPDCTPAPTPEEERWVKALAALVGVTLP